MIRNIIYFGASVLLFFCFMVAYGVILNSNSLPLERAMSEAGIDSLSNVYLVIDRKNYKIKLYSDSIFVKDYKAVFGQNDSRVKTSYNDLVTPSGYYRVCEILDEYKYHKFIRLNFPNIGDAAEALKNGDISKADYSKIKKAYEEDLCPPPDTELGNEIGIHGIGDYDYIFRNLPFVFNWTNGSAAISNSDIDELASIVKKGTLVKIE